MVLSTAMTQGKQILCFPRLGGTSMVSYSIMTLTPQAFYYAPILLPFAVGNGVVAGRGRPSEDRRKKAQRRFSVLSRGQDRRWT